MSRVAIHAPGKLITNGPYSPGVRCGPWVFVSGQGPLNHESGKFENFEFGHQVRLTLENVRSVLSAAGCTMNDVVKVNVHLQNINDFDQFNAIYCEFFAEPRPARTTVQSVLGAGISIEVDVIACSTSG